MQWVNNKYFDWNKSPKMHRFAISGDLFNIPLKVVHRHIKICGGFSRWWPPIWAFESSTDRYGTGIRQKFYLSIPVKHCHRLQRKSVHCPIWWKSKIPIRMTLLRSSSKLALIYILGLRFFGLLTSTAVRPLLHSEVKAWKMVLKCRTSIVYLIPLTNPFN